MTPDPPAPTGSLSGDNQCHSVIFHNGVSHSHIRPW
jgi:hypothetical protein